MTMKLVKSMCEEPADKKHAQLIQKKKAVLLKELENELKHLDEMDNQDFTNQQEPELKDLTLKRLQMIYKQANKLQIKQIEKLSRLAIGKRILNLQLKRRKDQHNTKLRKKEKIELFFRENRIKRFDYSTLMEQRLKQSTLVVKANDNGKGFTESEKHYRQDYSKALIQCNYIKNIKQVNRIFYANYSGVNKKETPLSQLLMKLVWIPLIVFLIMGLTLPFVSFQNQEIILLILLGVILLILFYVVIATFRSKPNENNQIEQSISDVRKYFEKINDESDLNGTNIEWRVSPDFMYLQVIFHNGFPN